jgi:hypothetical protein
MIGRISVRELFAHLKSETPDFNSRVAALTILAAYFAGDEILFPDPDEGASDKAAFRIVNWETIGALSPEQKAFFDKYADETNPAWNKFCEDNYEHYEYYPQNRSSLLYRLISNNIIHNEIIHHSGKPDWTQIVQYISTCNRKTDIADYFIDTIEVRNSAAYSIINHFGWNIPQAWIESFCIDLKNVGKRGRKSNQPKQTPDEWLQRIIDDGWHKPTQNGAPTAAAIIQNLFCPHIKLDTIRRSIEEVYATTLKAADQEILMSNRSLNI